MINQRSSETIDFPARRRPPRRFGLIALVIAALLLFVGGGTAVSYYVDALWFGALGYGDVFWRTLGLQALIFTVTAGLTFAVLFGAFLALKPAGFGELGEAGVIMINDRPIKVPVGPALTLIAAFVAAVVALGTAGSMAGEWPAIALWWYGHATATAAAQVTEPIFGRPVGFYLFTLPVWQLGAGWLLQVAILSFAVALFFFVTWRGTRILRGHGFADSGASRGLALTWSLVLVAIAAETYVGRFGRLFDEHPIFSGVTYTDAHVTLTGAWLVSAALLLGALGAALAAFVSPRVRWLILSAVPALLIYIGTGAVASYVEGFIVKPNELVREQPFITHNIALTQQAFGLHRIARRAFPAEPGVEAADAANNQTTLQNIRLWDWRVLQDTLRQLQEIRTYYDFPDIDIDRYMIDGSMRQVMLATRELNVSKLPEGSRTWINEKLVYTHGYGLTMNVVNGFTPEGLPTLLLKDMPIQSATPSLTVTRPEVYFGEMTNTDVYVKTRQQEFNYPQGQTNSVTSYEGTGGILLGGFLRRFLIALDRGDAGKLPFSDDVTAESRLLMRRNLRDRVAAIAPFLELDPDPYIVLTDQGRLSWVMDAFTISEHYPYSRAYRVGNARANYVRNSVKVVIDAYDGTTTF